jgi:hypothetical protein
LCTGFWLTQLWKGLEVMDFGRVWEGYYLDEELKGSPYSFQRIQNCFIAVTERSPDTR